jgi:hypothetical protein
VRRVRRGLDLDLTYAQNPNVFDRKERTTKRTCPPSLLLRSLDSTKHWLETSVHDVTPKAKNALVYDMIGGSVSAFKKFNHPKIIQEVHPVVRPAVVDTARRIFTTDY